MSRVYELLSELASCLCAEIASADLPEPCFCGIFPGAEVPFDYMQCGNKCGMAWVRLITSYPSSAVGQQVVEPGNCGSAMGIEVEVGIIRCFPTNAAGARPTEAQNLAAVQTQMDDMQVLYKAVSCCPAIPAKDVVIGAYEPVGPEGLVYGGTIVLQMQVF